MRRCVFVLCVIICAGVLTLPVFAQETAPAATPDPLPELTKTYFSLLEQYRDQEQVFQVAKGQYLQLNTLASQEVAVKEARSVLKIRADILLTYLDLLIETLSRTTGIPIEQKNPQILTLSLLRDAVTLHKNAVESTQDRVKLDAHTTEFFTTFSEIETQTYYSLSLIRIGRIQSTIDKLLFVRDEVKKDVETRGLSPSNGAIKDRGFDEIGRTIDILQTTFTPIRAQTIQNKKSSLSNYARLSEEISPAFALINQTLAFLKEVRK